MCVCVFSWFCAVALLFSEERGVVCLSISCTKSANYLFNVFNVCVCVCVCVCMDVCVCVCVCVLSWCDAQCSEVTGDVFSQVAHPSPCT